MHHIGGACGAARNEWTAAPTVVRRGLEALLFGLAAAGRSELIGPALRAELEGVRFRDRWAKRAVIGCGHRASSPGDPVRSAVSKTPEKIFLKSREVDKSLYPATRILQSRLTLS